MGVKNVESLKGLPAWRSGRALTACERWVSTVGTCSSMDGFPVQKAASLREETRPNEPCLYLGVGRQNGKLAPLFLARTMPRG